MSDYIPHLWTDRPRVYTIALEGVIRALLAVDEGRAGHVAIDVAVTDEALVDVDVDEDAVLTLCTVRPRSGCYNCYLLQRFRCWPRSPRASRSP